MSAECGRCGSRMIAAWTQLDRMSRAGAIEWYTQPGRPPPMTGMGLVASLSATCRCGVRVRLEDVVFVPLLPDATMRPGRQPPMLQDAAWLALARKCTRAGHVPGLVLWSDGDRQHRTSRATGLRVMLASCRRCGLMCVMHAPPIGPDAPPDQHHDPDMRPWAMP